MNRISFRLIFWEGARASGNTFVRIAPAQAPPNSVAGVLSIRWVANREGLIVNHGQKLVAIFLKSCFKFYCEVLLVAVLAASQTFLANAMESGNAAPGVAPPEPGTLAAELQELDAGSVKSLRPELGHALLIVLPAQNGPADRAGLRPGDVILALNGKPALTLDEFNDLITRAGSGAEVQVEI